MTCAFDPTINLDEWTSRLLEPLHGARFPLSGSIELTERCNLNCVHCYINQPAASPKARADELSTEQWLRIIDQMADAGTFFLLITGGEPLLREDFAEIFARTRQRGMLVSLYSNATMLTDEIADMLLRYDLHSLEVSLYGASAESYEAITQQPGSFERCLRGIELALRKGLKLSLKSVILTSNMHELDQLKALTESFGCKFRYDSTLWPRLDGSMAPLRYQISDADMLRLDYEDPKRREGWEETARAFEGTFIRAERVFTCGAAHRAFHLDHRGQMSACMMLRKPSFDVPTLGFAQAWELLGDIIKMKRTQNTECESCSVSGLCMQCPGWSMAFHQDFETPVSSVCRMGKLRAEQFSIISD